MGWNRSRLRLISNFLKPKLISLVYGLGSWRNSNIQWNDGKNLSHIHLLNLRPHHAMGDEAFPSKYHTMYDSSHSWSQLSLCCCTPPLGTFRPNSHSSNDLNCRIDHSKCLILPWSTRADQWPPSSSDGSRSLVELYPDVWWPWYWNATFLMMLWCVRNNWWGMWIPNRSRCRFSHFLKQLIEGGNLTYIFYFPCCRGGPTETLEISTIHRWRFHAWHFRWL